jgi:hypothetical protein
MQTVLHSVPIIMDIQLIVANVVDGVIDVHVLTVLFIVCDIIQVRQLQYLPVNHQHSRQGNHLLWSSYGTLATKQLGFLLLRQLSQRTLFSLI